MQIESSNYFKDDDELRAQKANFHSHSTEYDHAKMFID